MDSEQVFFKQLLALISHRNANLIREFLYDQKREIIIIQSSAKIVKLAQKLISMDAYKIEGGVLHYGFTTNAAALMISSVLKICDNSRDLTKFILVPFGPSIVPHSELILGFIDLLEKSDLDQRNQIILNSGLIQLNEQLVSQIPPKAIPAPNEQLALLSLYSKFEQNVPIGSSFTCDVLTRWIAGSQDSLRTEEAMHSIIAFMNRSWERCNAQISESLEAVFLILMGDKIADSNDSDQRISPLLSLFFQALPSQTLDLIPMYISKNSARFKDSLLFQVIDRIIRYLPLNHHISALVMQILQGFCLARRKTLLSTITLTHSSFFLQNILNFEDKPGAVGILRKLILGFQYSPVAFHKILDDLHDCLIGLENSLLDEKYELISSISLICHVMLFKFPGFRERYSKIQSVLSNLTTLSNSLTDREKAQVLNQSNWITASNFDNEISDINEEKALENYRGKVTEMKGLLNLNNNCYANSVIQALFLSRGLLLAISSLKDNISRLLYSLLNDLKNSSKYCLNPESFLNAIFSGAPHLFRKGVQSDASEFLKFILDRMEDELKKIKTQDSTEELPFTGRVQNRIQCLECKTTSKKEEAFLELDLFFPEQLLDQQELSLNSLLDSYFSHTKLEKSDQYFCSTCNCPRDAILSPSIQKFPSLLVISLKRFQFSNGSLKKLMAPVDFPLKISLPNHQQNENEIYNLYACIIHSGSSAEYGHYYTIGRNPENQSPDWYIFNDSNIDKISYEQICNTCKDWKQDLPYLYFFYKS
jgi:ubiquitin C-terminal hydrolase